MARSFNALKNRMSAGSKEQVDAKVEVMMAEMPLYELRQAMELSQQQLAATLDVKQPAISKIERSTDMYISTLSRFVTAMGGSLEVIAHFPEGDVKINQFKDFDRSNSQSANA